MTDRRPPLDGDSGLTVEPWGLRETELVIDRLAETESIFALGNGHVGLRGNLEEGEPHSLPGSYLGGFFELNPLPYAEAAYGDPEEGQHVVNVTNGKLIRLLVGDSPFDVRYGELSHHERKLDFKAGTLTRDAEWTSPSHQTVKLHSRRLVSFAQRAIAAICYEVQAVDGPVRIVIESSLAANEELPTSGADPRSGAGGAATLLSELHECAELRAMTVHRTELSGRLVAAGMDHEVHGPKGTATTIESYDDGARLIIAANLKAGEQVRVVKYIGYGWSRVRSIEALRDQVAAALFEARATGWDGLLKAQRAFLDDFWKRADVEIDGDPALQQAIRFALFHVLQAAARAEHRAIAAKGLTGPGYDGHAFWDTEAFVLPVLTYTHPQAAADALAWRHATLDRARARAKQIELEGAAFPWRTIHGEECSGYWPAGTAAFHINADIALAVIRYWQATGDDDFAREVGFELLIETAQMWASLGHHDGHGGFRIDGVTGPDEYSAVADNNVYTNLMAQRNLRYAADAVDREPAMARQFKVGKQDAKVWRSAADAMIIPWDDRLGVHPQAEAFTEHQVWNFAGTPPDQYPLLLHFPYFDLYRKQVVKQADLVLALHVCGDSFTPEEKRADFDYYEPLTVRDSSLSASTQAIIAAEVGYMDLAYAYHREAAFMDLDNLEHNVRDGLHIASLAGAWTATVAGYGGMRDNAGHLRFAPRIPPALDRVRFRMCYQGSTIQVEILRKHASYKLLTGTSFEVFHFGEPLTVTKRAKTRTIPDLLHRDPPHQPPGREPRQIPD